MKAQRLIFLELGHQLYWERQCKTCVQQANAVRILESPGFSCGEYVNKTNEDGLLKIEMWVGDLFRRSGFIPYSIFNNNLGFDYYLGWKLKAADDCPTGKPIKAMIAMRINPLKGK